MSFEQFIQMLKVALNQSSLNTNLPLPVDGMISEFNTIYQTSYPNQAGQPMKAEVLQWLTNQFINNVSASQLAVNLKSLAISGINQQSTEAQKKIAAQNNSFQQTNEQNNWPPQTMSTQPQVQQTCQTNSPSQPQETENIEKLNTSQLENNIKQWMESLQPGMSVGQMGVAGIKDKNNEDGRQNYIITFNNQHDAHMFAINLLAKAGLYSTSQQRSGNGIQLKQISFDRTTNEYSVSLSYNHALLLKKHIDENSQRSDSSPYYTSTGTKEEKVSYSTALKGQESTCSTLLHNNVRNFNTRGDSAKIVRLELLLLHMINTLDAHKTETNDIDGLQAISKALKCYFNGALNAPGVWRKLVTICQDREKVDQNSFATKTFKFFGGTTRSEEQTKFYQSVTPNGLWILNNKSHAVGLTFTQCKNLMVQFDAMCDSRFEDELSDSSSYEY